VPVVEVRASASLGTTSQEASARVFAEGGPTCRFLHTFLLLKRLFP
jgi:hypothetical protein